jgi:hypothetical protein
MPAVLSTPAGATVTYFSSTWPWSLHASPASGKMTFWSDLLSALAQLMLLTSTAFITAAADFNLQTSTTITAAPSLSSSKFTSTVAYSSIASYTSHHPHGNSDDALKHTINQAQHRYGSDRLRNDGSSSASEISSTTTSEANVVVRKMLNHDDPSRNSSSTTAVPHREVTAVDAGQSNLVDCNDFTEQKLLNIVICAISDVNSNVIINGSSADNSTFNDTLSRNISDEFIRFYNASDGSEITGNNSTTTCIDFDYEPTLYFIQVITTAVVLGIIILATVIGECFSNLFFARY